MDNVSLDPVVVPPQKRKFSLNIGLSFLVLFFIIVSAVIGTLLYMDSKFEKEVKRESITKNTTEPTNLIAPTVQFASYSTPENSPIVPSLIKQYAIHSGYTVEDLKGIALKFGIDEKVVFEEDSSVVFSNIEKPESRGILVFNAKNGYFNYQSFGTLAAPAGTPTESAVIFLQNLGLYDPSIECDITYKKTTLPDVTFVECHRNWDTLGAPLVTLPGILNSGEGFTLAGAKPGIVTSNDPTDDTIINTSTNQDGKLRPNDFNTVTFAISSDNNILTINSTMRWITSSDKEISGENLLTPEQALTEFKNGEAEYSLVLPAGSGNVLWEKIFPENKAIASYATIDDFSLVYLEKVGSEQQANFKPYYLISGTTTVSSGYTTRFAQVVPAERTTFVLGTEDNLQLGTFKPSVTPTPPPNGVIIPTNTPTQGTANTPTPTLSSLPNTPTPTTPLRRPTSTPGVIPSGPQVACGDLPHVDSTLTRDFTIAIPGYGTMVVRNTIGNSRLFLVSSNAANPSALAAREAIFKMYEDTYIVRYQDPKTKSTIPKVKDYGGLTDEYYKAFGNNRGIGGPIPPQDAPENIKNSFAKRAIAIDNGASDFPYLPLLSLQPSFTLDQLILSGQDTDGANCYLTGTSPVIFLYPETTSNITVTTGSKLTYSDPAIKNNSWNALVNPDGSLVVGNQKRSNLYYEYDKQEIKFNEKDTGYIIERNKIESLINKISNKLILNKHESEALLNDSKNALIDLEYSDYIKVSFIDESEIDKKIPLSISPKPTSIRRIHLLITTSLKNNIKPPTINPIERSGFTVIELGAVGQ